MTRQPESESEPRPRPTVVVLTADGCQRLNNRPRALGVLPA